MTDTGSTHSRADRLRARVRDSLEERFGIDARALAAFRIALGLILLVDILHRSRYLVAFYTDDGVLPRALLFEQYPTTTYSIHALSGEPWVQALLFGCGAAVAVALFVGYRTRTATAVSLVLLVSMQYRNPFLLNGGDRLLHELVFLAVFLPLGTRWSIDALVDADDADGDGRKSDPGVGSDGDPMIVTPATAAMLGSIVVVFVSNALRKAEGDTWHSGEALHYALRQDHMTVLLGNHAVNSPLFLEVGTYVWTGLVTGAPLLLLLTGRLRTAYAITFIAAVTGMALSMAVGLFPAVLAGAFLLFLPPPVWDALESGGAAAVDRVGVLERIATAFRALTGRLRRPRTLGSLWPEPIRRRKRQCWSVIVTCLLLGVVLWSVALLGLADPFEPIDSVEPEDHQWEMFAPDPSTSYGWYVVEAEVDGGENLDVLRGTELRTDPPPDAAETLPDFRWRKYLNSLSDSDERADRFAAHMCETASARTDAPVRSVTVTYTDQPIALEGEPKAPTTETVVERSCSGDATSDRNPELRVAPT